MLYNSGQMGKDQLLSDLLAAREILALRWYKGGFTDGTGNVCIVQACKETTGANSDLIYGFVTVSKGTEDTSLQRLSRMIVVLYEVLAKGQIKPNLTISSAQKTIARFNDGPASQEAVLLLFDKAIELALQPVLVE